MWRQRDSVTNPVVFFAMGEFKPIYHVVWHVCVLIASLLMWFAIFLYVMPMDIAAPRDYLFEIDRSTIPSMMSNINGGKNMFTFGTEQ